MLITPFLILILIAVIFFFGTAMLAGVSAAPWLPTKGKDVGRFLSLVKLKPSDLLYDLGCGDARLLIAAAKQYGAKGVGYEISLLHYLWSWLRVLMSGSRKRVTIKYQSFYQADFGPANAVVCFLTPKAMKKLQPKIMAEMHPGSRFVTYCFSLPGKEATEISRPTNKSIPIYLYRIN